MKNTDFTLAKLLTFQFSLGGLLMFFLLINSSPKPGESRGDERMINPICNTAPTANLDYSLRSPALTVTTARGVK